MKPTRSVRVGRICKKHPYENGLRYVGNNRCVECAKEESRKHYASLEMTPAQKITTLLGEVAKLKDQIETLRVDAERFQFIAQDAESSLERIYGDNWLGVADQLMGMGEKP